MMIEKGRRCPHDGYRSGPPRTRAEACADCREEAFNRQLLQALTRLQGKALEHVEQAQYDATKGKYSKAADHAAVAEGFSVAAAILIQEFPFLKR